MTNVAIEQPTPVTGGEVVLPHVIEYIEFMGHPELVPDLVARAEMGHERYGTYLMTHNGRDALMDAYQECLDGLMYLTQASREVAADEERRHRLVRIRMYLLVATDWLQEELQNR